VRPLGLVGSLSRDLVDGRPARPGGAVYYAAKALRLLGRRAEVLTKCAASDRALLRSLVAFGLPVTWSAARETTSFAFSYEGDQRQMTVAAVGDPWRPEEIEGALAGVRWLHVGALLRSDFPPDTLAELARGRKLSLDAHALVRSPEVGPLKLDADFDSSLLQYVQILKLSQEEAEALLGEVNETTISTLGVPEVVVTLGHAGSIVFAGGKFEQIQARPLGGIDPTGAGDSFAAAYLAARSTAHTPVGAAQRASTLVTGMLEGRLQ